MSLMKKLSLSLSSFAIIILFTFSFACSSEKNIAKGKAKITDGDTIKINGERIRFGGIDTPERGEIGHKFSKQKLKEKIGNNVAIFLRFSVAIFVRYVAVISDENHSLICALSHYEFANIFNFRAKNRGAE